MGLYLSGRFWGAYTRVWASIRGAYTRWLQKRKKFQLFNLPLFYAIFLYTGSFDLRGFRGFIYSGGGAILCYYL